MKQKQVKKIYQEKSIQKIENNVVQKSLEAGFEDISTAFLQENNQNNDGIIDDLDYYFNSYSHFGIHEDMLKDKVRTEAYRDAILKNSHLFQEKIVLDIGCGTGILSIFAARAGAKHVYAIDNANIAIQAKKIVKTNNLEEKITIIKGKVEEVNLGVEKVDIIISEWMGYFLLYESMLDTVIFARDKWLKQDGIMFPDRAVLFIAGIDDGDYKREKMEFWDEVYGVDMSCIKQWVLQEPMVDILSPNHILTSQQPILDIDLQTVTIKQLNFTAKFSFQFNSNSKLNGLVSWFDNYFSHSHPNPILLSTSPNNPKTHWKQTIFYISQTISVSKSDVIQGNIAVKKNSNNHRQLNIKIGLQHNNYPKIIQCYQLA